MREWLTPARRRSIVWIAVSTVLFLTIAALAYSLLPVHEVATSATERVINTLLQLRWPALLLLLMLSSLFRIMDTEAALDPLSNGESMRFRRNRQVFQNSLEQFVLFVPALLGFAVFATEPMLWHVVPVAVLLFTLGRIAFWIGYHISPNARTPGFMLTFSTTFVLYAALFWLAA